MSNTIEQPPVTPAPPVATPPKPSIKVRLERELARDKGQIVKATNVWGDNYRINWYSTLDFSKGLDNAGSGKIVKSIFASVTVGPDDALTVEDKTLRGPSPNSRPFGF